MTMRAIPICEFCEYKIKGVRKCSVFTDGIPDEAYDDDHLLPIDGDNGVVFKPAKEFENDEYVLVRADDFRRELTTRRLEKERELFPDIQKETQPIEEWANEYMCKEMVKADLSIFVNTLVSMKHWVFASLTREQSESVYMQLVEHMLQDKWSLSDLAKPMQEAEPAINDIQANAIGRSEITLIVNKSREMQFEEDAPGKYGYYWSGPSDHRTTEICTAIKARVPKDGVDTVDELKQIVREEAQKFYDAKGYKTTVREWLPHPNCRHTIISKARQ